MLVSLPHWEYFLSIEADLAHCMRYVADAVGKWTGFNIKGNQ